MSGAAITLRGATLRYGRDVVWEDLNLDVAPGECLIILGPNGAGKTAPLKVLLGLLLLSAGTITIDGRPPRRGSPQIGYIAQQRAFDQDLPIRGRRTGRPIVRRPAAAAAYSPGAGWRPPAAAVRRAAADPGPASQQSVTSLLDRYRREHGTTVVLVTHEIAPVAGLADRVLYVAGGRWAAGSPETVMTSKTLSALYGSHVDVIHVHGQIVVVAGQAADGHHPDGRDR